MLVPDEIRKCVAFIGYRDQSGMPRLAGTVFFIGKELDDIGLPDRAAVYMVTAQHVIDKIRDKGGRGVVRLNMQGGKAVWADIDPSMFVSHPDHPHIEAVDAAVAPVGLTDAVDYMTVPTRMFVTDDRIRTNRIGVGDEVFVSGLFWNHHGKDRNLPIVRVGNIAGMPEEKVETKKYGDVDAYLVEARSIGGLSGSPVFVHLGLTRVVDKAVKFAQGTDYGVFYLMGVMQGHWDSNALLDVDEFPEDDDLGRERVNMGIAIVTPINKVLEILEQPELKRHKQIVADATKKRLAEDLPVADAVSEPSFTRDDFEQALRKVAKKLPDSESAQTSGDH
jgi:hypothetical protein